MVTEARHSLSNVKGCACTTNINVSTNVKSRGKYAVAVQWQHAAAPGLQEAQINWTIALTFNEMPFIFLRFIDAMLAIAKHSEKF